MSGVDAWVDEADDEATKRRMIIRTQLDGLKSHEEDTNVILQQLVDALDDINVNLARIAAVLADR